MRTLYPVQIDTVYVGKAGDSGSFVDPETGEKIDFAEAFAFDFDSADGNVQRLVLRANKIDDAAQGFDVAKLKRYEDRLRFEGDVVVNDSGRSYFKPVKITRAPAAA